MNSNTPPSRFSQDIQYLLERLVDQPLTLAHVLSKTAERSFCLVIGLLVLPSLSRAAGFHDHFRVSLPAAVRANGGGAKITLAAPSRGPVSVFLYAGSAGTE